MASRTPDVGSLTYEQARDELTQIVAKLEAGAATLDESLALWERGEALAARCQDLLDGAGKRIAAARATVVDVDGSGEPLGSEISESSEEEQE